MSNNPEGILARLGAFRKRHPIIVNLIYIFLVAFVMAEGAMFFLDFWTHHGDNAVVPQIKYLSYDKAEKVLAEAGLSIEISDSIYDKKAQPGTVIESWPKAGAIVKAGRQVYVTVNAFSPKKVSLTTPITGVSLRQATGYLESLGISAIRIVNVPSAFPDLVEGAECDGRPIGVGSRISVASTVILKVGTAMADSVAADSLDAVTAEDAIINDFTSTYEPDAEEL